MTTVPKQTPKYAKIVDYIKGEIDTGRLQHGDRIPSLQELATMFDVAAETVRGAIMVLRVEGLVDTKHGLGTFVTRDRKPAMDKLGDSVPEAVLMLISRLATERDEQAAAILENLASLRREVAEWRLGDDRDHQFATISRQLDGMNQMLATLTRA